MRTFCITVNGRYEAAGGLYGTAVAPGTVRTLDRTRAHFAQQGVNAQFFYGFNAPLLGLKTVNPYEVDAPGSGYNMGPKPTGIWLSHRALWAACLLMPPEGLSATADEDEFLILEDDAKFDSDWILRLSQAVIDLGRIPWNMLFLGSCCTEGKVKSHIRGQVYEVKWPMCLQAYIVKRKALQTLIETQDAATCYGPIDITLMFHTYEQLGGVYTILPRIVHQWDTEIPE